MDNKLNDYPSHSELVVAYALCGFSGFIVGIALGWIVWA